MGQIDEWRSHVNYIGENVADALCVRKPQSAFGPAVSRLIPVVPVCFERCATKQRQHRRKEVEGRNQRDRKPYDGLVYLREIEHQQPCADRPLQDRDTNNVEDLRNPEEVRVTHNIDRWIKDVSPQASIDDHLVESSRVDVEKLQTTLLDLPDDLKWVRNLQWR